MLLKELANTFESDSKHLKINLSTEKVSGPIELLKQLKADDVTEVDLDEVEEDSEGNLAGALLIWMGNKSIEVTGEHFSPMWVRYSVLKSKTDRQKVINELIAKINRELNLNQITEGSMPVYDHLVKALEQAEQRLKTQSNTGSSYNIGGNYNAVVSGNVEIRHNYIDYGPYDSPTKWDIILEIGNNIKGKDSLKEAESIFRILIGTATNAGAEVSKSDEYSAVSAVITDGSVKLVIRYAYARSFCWVGITRIQ